ncbi:hypothetical protein DICPUDRAFT_146927 [Dictyostelium purpureum]|uniref:EGF-like domain-containing protein n=1 Tax=Dictyostelium purpureum TaxID=5786 RepID=F0Z791_DICPU|nr:uncharacterized protein DICPUDRAFT_146927 [Dictyostelium purpureum]EGC40218.1 hypothetical protein DICPUDRAFT_146927 [Dictyostelium purpureum]|eukprot:XP_003283287.1 hypothetical protein DICPUDRAFT_146927 [Dictyostelium purpureum]
MKIKFIFLLIITYFIDSLYCYIIKNVDTRNITSAYLIQGTQCDFYSTIYCSVTQLGEQCDTLNYSFPPLIPSVTKNGTTSVFNLMWKIPVSETAIYINSIYVFTLSCIQISIDDLTFKPFSKGYYLEPNIYKKIVTYSAIYQVQLPARKDKTPLKISGSCVGIPDCVLEWISGDKYKVGTKETISNMYDLSSIKVAINIQGTTKEFDFGSIYSDVYDSVYGFKVYQEGSLATSFLYTGDVLSFKSNTTVYKTSYLISKNNDPRSSHFFPVYGDGNSTTYFYSVPNCETVSIDVYYRSGPIVLKSDQSFDFQKSSCENFPGLYSNGVANSLDLGTNGISNIVNIGYSDSRFIVFPPIEVEVLGISTTTQYPFGFVFSNSTGSQFSYDIPYKIILRNSDNLIKFISSFDSTGSNINIRTFGTYALARNPKITKIEEIYLMNGLYLYRFQADTSYGFSYIKINSLERVGFGSSLNGDLYQGEYEVATSSLIDIIIQISDVYEGSDQVTYASLISIEPELQIFSKKNFKVFDVFSIKNVSYLYNDIDVSNRRHYNVFYFNYSDIPRETLFTMIPTDLSVFSPVFEFDLRKGVHSFYSTYNTDIQMFQIEFYIDANVGMFDFFLFVNGVSLSSMVFDTQLRVKNKEMDLQGPIIKSLTKITPSLMNVTNNFDKVGFRMTIEDSTNGFDYGYVVFKGAKDSGLYNISFNFNDVKPGGNIFLGEYDVLFNISYPCTTQSYFVWETLLVDKMNRRSFFSYDPPNPKLIGAASPYINYISSSSRQLIVTCSPILQLIKSPILKSFKASTNEIDVSKANRNVTFNFSASDPETGLKLDMYPIVYLSASQNPMLECKSSIVKMNKTDASYTCTIELPLGYAYPNQILISVYGFINNYACSRGYTTADLVSGKFDYGYINTIFQTNDPVISKHSRISERGGDLLLFGRGFSSDSTAYITFNDGTTSVIKASTFYATTVIFSKVRGTTKPYKVYVKSNNKDSNIFTVVPTIYDYDIHLGPVEPQIPTESPIPTNQPQKCSGNPVCGGSSQGKCIENQGCVCFSPWIGIDCSSQIVIIDPPAANDTSPTTNITLPSKDSKNSTVSYKSLITLVSLREINIFGDIVFNKPFETWRVSQSDTNTYVYNSKLEIIKNNQTSYTNVIVTLKWFINETTISFANEELLMNPSTMKYTVRISDYPFDSVLNQLELVMSAVIQSNTTKDICSVRDFSDTTSGDNSNYLKIQVDNHSLYGRFIKRGIIDSTVKSISNVLLDKHMNPISTTNQLQSYIGIRIPNYKENVILDPDFSVLVDSNAASSKSGSICSNSSKLSNAKIAGIVYNKIKKIHTKELKGPFAIPILGNLHQLGKYGLPHHTLTEFHKKYGPIYRVFFGDVYTVVINDPKIIREICMDHHETIGRNRPVTPSFRYAQNGNGISTSNEQWQRNREIVQNALKRGASTKKIYEMLDGQVSELIKSMKKFEESGEPFEIHLYAHRYTLATMFKYIFNEDVDYNQDINQSKIAELNGPLAEIFKDLSSGKLGDFIYILAPIYYLYLCFTEKNVKNLKNYMKEKYNQHLSTYQQDDPRDLLDILIKEYGSEKNQIDAIIGVIFDLFLAGSDTAAASIEWFTLRMCNNLDIQDKVYNEIKSVVGDRGFVKLTDRPSTPFLNAVIKESLRYSPVGPFGLPKYCVTDVMVGGHFIPKNSQILFNYRGLGFNEEYFENPHQFDPLRFLNQNNDAYIPFGLGDRNCVGQDLASSELYLAFANIVLNFNLTSLDGKPIDDTENFGLTLKPNKFKINLKSRNLKN